MNMTTSDRLPATLNDLFLLAMMLAIAAILTVAMIFQYYGGEIPCPLCLLQRVAMFGVCLGIILHFRHGYSARNTGFSMLFALLLLIVSVRQTLLDIYPRPGHSYIGSAVFGLHMPVWSIVIAVAILLAFATKSAVLGDPLRDPQPSPTIGRVARLLSLYVIALCLINFGSVIVQCGVDACHTSGYRLLRGSKGREGNLGARHVSKRGKLMSKLRSIPAFKSDVEKRKFWETHDSTDYIDWSKAERARFPNLKPSTTAISIRLPLGLLEQIKIAANKRDVPYQSLIKMWLAEKVG